MTRPSSRWASEKEVRARHILVRAAPGDEKASKAAEDKIKAIIARLKKGEDFAKVAKEVTEDPSGKANGGDLGYFTKEQMVPEFAEAAFKLDKGEISEPVKTQFGWHVIKVEDKRTQAAADLRRGQAADRAIRDAQGAGRLVQQAARRSQDREALHGRAADAARRAGARRRPRREEESRSIDQTCRHGRATESGQGRPGRDTCPGHLA